MTDGGERVSSGIAGLDTVLNGGFFKGGIYLVQGTPGTGKTILANQLCFGQIMRGARALYVTLLAEFHARMFQHLRSLAFFDESKIPDDLYYISGFRMLRDEGLGSLLALIRREILARRASVLVLDGLVAAQRIADDDQAFNEFVHELQGIAVASSCTMFLVTSAADSGNITPQHTMVDGIVELSDLSFGRSAARSLRVIKLRGGDYLRGQHTYQISDGGMVVYPRIEAQFATPPTAEQGRDRMLSSGVRHFDAMLGGGISASSSTLLLGPAGIGKTTFGMHFLSACTAAEPGLLFGFYETPPRIRAKALEICPALAAALDRGDVEILWQPPSHDILDVYGARLLSAVRRRGVKRLFIDGLAAFKNAAEAEQRLAHYLPALLNELRAQGVTTLHTLETQCFFGPILDAPLDDISALAENLILLRHVEVDSRLHRLLSILKVRDSDFDPLMHEFFITDDGIRIDESHATAVSIAKGVPPVVRAASVDDGSRPPPAG